MGQLTTHVLDTARGSPAAGMRIELYRTGTEDGPLKALTTNSDGRVDTPLLDGDAYRSGTYELRFFAGDYLKGIGLPSGFLDVIPIRFSIDAEQEHYHVPLLLSPFGYTTYRGS